MVYKPMVRAQPSLQHIKQLSLVSTLAQRKRFLIKFKIKHYIQTSNASPSAVNGMIVGFVLEALFEASMVQIRLW
jgi:hypothetical protein